MFEQQHKLETFLMKDLIDMLSLVAPVATITTSRKRRRAENVFAKLPKRNGSSRA